jgi:hypothetical protein
MSLVVCTMPTCQSTAGCVCQPYPKIGPHTNCWCDPDIIRCYGPACPRAHRQAVQRAREQAKYQTDPAWAEQIMADAKRDGT